MTTGMTSAVTTTVSVRLDGAVDLDHVIGSLAAALWPSTADSDRRIAVCAAGHSVDLALRAADGTRAIGALAGELTTVGGARRPDAVVLAGGHAPDDDEAPIVLRLTEAGVELTAPAAHINLLAARIAHASAVRNADPTLPVEALPPSRPELDLLRRWAGAPVRYGAGTSVDRIVAAVAADAPDRVALRRGQVTLTYGDLLRRANRLAVWLQGCGVRAGDIVVLRLPRGFDLVIAMLGVLRAGAGYCAVDPAWPAARVRDVIADTRPPVLLGTAPPGCSPPIPVVSITDATIASAAPAAVPHGALDGPFCVYFTSGSTGRPKGVLSSHRATLRTLLSPTHPRLGPGVVTMSAAPLPWDACTLELWSALLHGGSCLLTEREHLTPADLRRHVTVGVDTIWLTATLFNVLVDEDVDAFAGLRQVLIGGERLSSPHVVRFRQRHSDITLINGYGPVEATVFASTHEITDADVDDPAGIPIGRPLPATEVLVLRQTSDGRVVRAVVGEPGEICVAGDGLAEGYLGHAAPLTDERFPVLRPDGEQPRRVYRTGDIGAWRPDGVLVFRGRADRQVKVRGHRVEPGEIETVAVRDGHVRQCAVVPVRDGSGRVVELAAYVVPAAGPFDVAVFVADLAATLPAYLVPAHVVPLPSFPLGSTGKLDVAALPPVGPATRVRAGRSGPATSVTGWDPPSHIAGTASAATVDAVTAEAAALLGLSSVAPDDDLLGLGLDSLAATRLAARLHRLHGADADVATVLDARTPRALAAAFAGRAGGPAAATHSTGPNGPAVGEARIRFWLDDTLRPERAIANVVVLAYCLAGDVVAEQLHDALRRIVGRHDALRTAVTADDDGIPVARPLTVDAAVRVRHGRGPHEPFDVRAFVAGLAVHLASAVDLERGPLTVAETAPTPDGLLLVLAVHHAAFDGHSTAVLGSEISAALRGALLLTPRPYTPREGGTGQAVPAVWVDRFREVQDLQWPPGMLAERPGVREIPVHVSADRAAVFVAQARRWATTPYVVALTAFAGALAEVTATGSFSVGTPVSDRSSADEDTIGLYVATVPVPVVGPAAPDPHAAVAAMARTVGQALQHRNVPLSALLRALRRRATGRHPLFQVQFAWQNHPRPVWDVPGVRVEEIRVPSPVAQLDLTLELWPSTGPGPLTGVVEYDPSVVTDAAAAAVVNAFIARLGGH